MHFIFAGCRWNMMEHLWLYMYQPINKLLPTIVAASLIMFLTDVRICLGCKFIAKNPILINSTSLSCWESSYRSRIGGVVNCEGNDDCYAIWAIKEESGSTQCGLCQCVTEAKFNNLTYSQSSALYLRLKNPTQGKGLCMMDFTSHRQVTIE